VQEIDKMSQHDENALTEQELIQEALKPKKERQKFNIEHLRDAVNLDGKFLLKAGDDVLVELSTDRGFWLYTTIFKIQWVKDDGNVGLYDEYNQRCAGMNYKYVGKNLKLKIPSTLK
jgi:hypothetical protein